MAAIEENINDLEKEEEEEDQDHDNSSSSELAELEAESRPEDEHPWRKGKLSAAQYGLKKFDRLFGPEQKQTILKSEARLVATLDSLLDQVNSTENVSESTDAKLGENIRKALFAINKISESVIVSLKRPNVTQFLGKVFEYLKATPRNPIISLSVLNLLKKTRFDCLDLSAVEATLNRPEYLSFLIDEVLESTAAKDTDLRIGQEAFKECYKIFMAIINRINGVFASNFAPLKEALHTKRLDFHSKKGLAFRLGFIPYKKLERDDVEFIAFELQNIQNTDTKLPVEHSVLLYSQLVKNKNFKPTHREIEKMIRDASDLSSSLSKRQPKAQKAIINKMSGLLANLLFKPDLSDDEVDLVINATVGFFDTVVDDFHPKSAISVKKIYYQFLVQYFLTHYVREAKKNRRRSPELYAKIRDVLHPVLKKIMNFSIFDRFNGPFEKGLMALCYLDKDYFVDYLLQKVRFSFDFEEFRKSDVIKLLGSIAEIFTSDEQLSSHLMWIIPKLLAELANSAEAKNVEETSSVIASILENFIDLGKLEKKSHLASMQNDIDEAAIRYLEFYLSKSETYTMRKEALRIVAGISEYVLKKVKDKVLALAKHGFAKMSEENVTNFVSVCYRLFPAELDAELVKWLKNKVLIETDKYDTTSLALGPSLVDIGVDSSLTVKLGSTNDKALKDFTRVLRAVMPLSYLISDELLKLSTTALALIADHDNEEISKDAIIALGTIFNEALPKINNLVSIIKIKETTDKDGCSSFVWEFPEKSHKDRLETLVKAFVLKQFEISSSLMEVAHPREVAEDPISQLYNDTLAEKSTVAADLEQENKASSKKLLVVLRFTALIFKSQWLRISYVNSIQLQALFSSLKQSCLTYFAKSGFFKNPKLRDCYLSLLLTNLRVYNLALEGEDILRMFMKAMHGYYAYFDQVDSSFRTLMLEMIYSNYHALHGYFFPSEVLSIDALNTSGIEAEPHQLWLYGGHLEKTFITEALDETLQSSIFFSLENLHQNLQKETNKHLARWVMLEESHIREKLFTPVVNVMSIEQSSSEKYSATAIQVREAVYLFMSKIYIQESSTVESLLNLAQKIAAKSDFAKVQSLYFQFTNYLLLSAALSENSKWRSDFKSLLEALRSKDDASLTLADLVQYSVKILLTYQTWSAADRADFGLTCLLGVASKNINKRIVFMSMLFFLNRLIKKTDWKEEKIIILGTSFADERGFVSIETTKEVFQQIKYNIGFSERPSSLLTDAQREQLKKVDRDCYPGQASQYLALPFEALRFVRVEDTNASFNQLVSEKNLQQTIEQTFLDFVKITIMEYSDSVEESNLFVKYSYAEYMVSIERKGTINRESLILATFKQAALMLGVKSVCQIIRKLNEETTDKNSDYQKVVLILYCALLSMSSSFSDSDYIELLAFGREILVPLMNAIHAKHLQTLMIYLFVSIKNASFVRNLAFYRMVADELKKSAPENRSYFLNILVFQLSTSSLMIADFVEDLFTETAPEIDVSDLKNVKTLAKFYATVLSVRYAATLTPDFKLDRNQDFTSSQLTSIALSNKEQSIQGFLEFIGQVKTSKILIRMECLKSVLVLFQIRSVDSQSYDFMEAIISLVFTLDPNEDMGVSQLVAASHKLIEMLRGEMHFTRDVKNRLLNYLNRTFDTLHNVDCIKSLVKMVRRGVGNEITPALEQILFKVARDPRVTLRDSIDSLFRHDVFAGLSNKVVYSFAKQIFSKIDAAVAEKSKIKEKTDERFKALSKELDQYCVLLIGMVTARQWQLDSQVEQVLKYIIKTKKNSTEASKRFSNFMTHFWSKKIIHQDFNDYEIDSDLKDELNEYSNPYSYHA